MNDIDALNDNRVHYDVWIAVLWAIYVCNIQKSFFHSFDNNFTASKFDSVIEFFFSTWNRLDA